MRKPFAGKVISQKLKIGQKAHFYFEWASFRNYPCSCSNNKYTLFDIYFMAARKHRWLRMRLLFGRRLLQMLISIFVMLTISGLVHAAQESVEAVMQTDDHLENCCDSDGEHDCYGFVHSCSCCPTSVAVNVHTLCSNVEYDRGVIQRLRVPENDESIAIGIHRRIERPPQP